MSLSQFFTAFLSWSNVFFSFCFPGFTFAGSSCQVVTVNENFFSTDPPGVKVGGCKLVGQSVNKGMIGNDNRFTLQE